MSFTLRKLLWALGAAVQGKFGCLLKIGSKINNWKLFRNMKISRIFFVLFWNDFEFL